jgi:probable O-glycosylation ligase (exosortase A-associated)
MLIIPALLSGTWPILTHPLCVGMVAFMGTALIGQLHAVNPALGWFHVELLARIMLVSLLIPALITSRSRYTTAVAVMCGSLGYHGAKFGAGFILHGGVSFDSGIGGAFGANNEFALAVARIVMLMIAVIQNVKPKWAKGGFTFAMPFCVLGIVSTYSRGAFLALAGGCLVWVALQRRRALAVTAIACAVGGLFLFAPIQSSYLNRLGTIQTYDKIGDRSAKGRIHFWRVALIMAEANPMGVGLRNFEQAYDQYDFSNGQYGSHRSVHNSYLQALTEAGFLGLFVWVLLFLSALWIGLKTRRLYKRPELDPETQRFFFTSSNALIASLIAFMIGGSFGAEVLSDLNWFSFGLMVSLDRLGKEALAAARQPIPQQPAAATMRWSQPAVATPGLAYDSRNRLRP